ncbi:hypothetical protein Hanom_Chr03g00257331 [Helianthus anomalus]
MTVPNLKYDGFIYQIRRSNKIGLIPNLKYVAFHKIVLKTFSKPSYLLFFVLVIGERLSVLCDPYLTLTLTIIFCGIQVKGEYGWRRFVWIVGEVLPIIPLSCIRAGGGRVSAHLEKPRGWRRLSSLLCPQRPMSRIHDS